RAMAAGKHARSIGIRRRPAKSGRSLRGRGGLQQGRDEALECGTVDEVLVERRHAAGDERGRGQLVRKEAAGGVVPAGAMVTEGSRSGTAGAERHVVERDPATPRAPLATHDDRLPAAHRAGGGSRRGDRQDDTPRMQPYQADFRATEGGRGVDATGGWLVSAKSESPLRRPIFCPPQQSPLYREAARNRWEAINTAE